MRRLLRRTKERTSMRRDRLTACILAAVAGAGLPCGLGAQTCPKNVPHVTGTWVTLPYQMPINPISATLLRDGKVLIVAGSEAHALNHSEGAETYRAAVWDPTGEDVSSIVVQNLTYDVFCSGTAVLPDGRPLVVGGTTAYGYSGDGGFRGDSRASIFDPATGRFVQSQPMTVGRWYATATELGDGRIMAFSGRNETGGNARKIEIYDLRNASAGWSTASPFPPVPPLYPRQFLLPSGKVFYTGHGSDGRNPAGYFFSPTSGTWSASAPTTRLRKYGSAVILPLLPPSYAPRIMVFGGSGVKTTEAIDPSADSPAWTPGPNMSTGRIQVNAILLPNGKVLVAGGSASNEVPDLPGRRADLYDPATDSMSPGGTAWYSRLYHSVALLLPDATVATLGSNPPPRGGYAPAIEIYTPPYLFDADDQPITAGRPRITGLSPASEAIGYGAPFSVSYTSSSAIGAAVLVRPGSVTHSFDMDQRVIGLCGPEPQPPCADAGGTLQLTSPPDGNIAPPGYYMLFLLDSAGVPSKAEFVQLSPYAGPPPDGAIASPEGDVTIEAGGSVSFDTSSSAAKYSWVFPGGSPGTSVARTPGAVTFRTAGIYEASLTVIDPSGNSDPSPATRTITVTPAAADFSIGVSPPAVEVNPGGSATFTVTVSPLGGFSGPVSLSVASENGFPAGVSGGFGPDPIVGAGSAILTMNTTAGTKPWALSLTITGTSGTLSRTASTTLLVNLAPPSSLTATAGNGQVSLSWAPSAGATSYTVKRATVSGGPYVTVACRTGTRHVDSAVSDGTTYHYVVASAFTGNRNAGGASADSSEASATPGSASKALGARTAPAGGLEGAVPVEACGAGERSRGTRGGGS
jgi:hypothetical protein